MTFGVASTLGTRVTTLTIRNILYDANVRGRSPRKTPFISETNRVKKLNLKHFMSANIWSFGKMLFFPDESKFNIFDSDVKMFR